MTPSSTSSCPVPDDQLPLNEYQALRDAWLFRWATFSWQGLGLRLFWVWALSLAIAAPVAGGSFPPGKQLGHFLLGSAAGAGAVVLLVLVRIYSGWLYVRGRLLSETVEYEESGWYDGQRWTKTSESLTQDRLVAQYQAQPPIRQLQKTFGALGLAYLLGVGAWFLT